MFMRIAMMANEGPVSALPDENRASWLYTFTWILCSLSVISSGLRMYTRATLLRNLWWDDWFILLSVVRN